MLPLPEVAGVSDVGRTRSRNEDAMVVEADLGLVAVADGMGGHPAGDVASSLAVREITEALREPVLTPEGRPNSPKDVGERPGERMLEAVRRANDRILGEGEQVPERAGMGTTLTALRVSPEDHEYLVAHVGDSRGYLFADGALRRLTRDHTWVQEMIDAGKLEPAEGRAHPLRHILSRALGIGRPVSPEIVRGRGRPGDVFLLCTDGLVGMLTDAEVEAVLRDELPGGLRHAAETLVGVANARGGPDNITVALLRIPAA